MIPADILFDKNTPSPFKPVWNMTVKELKTSGIPEECVFGSKALERIENLHQTLTTSDTGKMPLLNYLQGNCDGVFLVTSMDRGNEKIDRLFLNKAGQWLVEEGKESSCKTPLQDGHLQFPAGHILQSLNRLVREAEEARCSRLQSIADAERKLKELGAPPTGK